MDECQRVRVWRNAPDVLPMLRTGYKTEAEQAAFYWRHCWWPWWRSLIQTPEHRYYAVVVDRSLLGIAGLTYLTRVPGEAEISLVLGPDFRRMGIGTQAVQLILQKADELGLTAVTGECYAAGNVAFWRKQAERRGARFVRHVSGSWVWRWAV